MKSLVKYTAHEATTRYTVSSSRWILVWESARNSVGAVIWGSFLDSFECPGCKEVLASTGDELNARFDW